MIYTLWQYVTSLCTKSVNNIIFSTVTLRSPVAIGSFANQRTIILLVHGI